MRDSYVRFFATRHEASAHAVKMTLKADAPLLAVHGPEDDFAVVDTATALDLGDGDIDRVRLL